MVNFNQLLWFQSGMTKIPVLVDIYG